MPPSGKSLSNRHALGSAGLMEGHDLSELSAAKAHWLFGEWQALAALNLDTLKHLPDRARYALLVAAAQHQIGQHDAAKRSLQLALGWGSSLRLAAQVLVASLHNTLGRASALAKNEARSLQHIRDSLQIGQPASTATELLAHARLVRELAELGLLPQAANLVERDYANATSPFERPHQLHARLKMLESEIGLIRGALNQAIIRGQLHRRDHAQPATLGAEISSQDPKDDDFSYRKRLQQASPSQLGQDLWVLERTGYKRNGFFVEFGAGDGVFLSNTYLLEKEFDWQGICAEPNPKFFEQLKGNRKCIVSDACIAAETGQSIDFVLAGEYGGMLQHAESDSHAEKRSAYKELGKVIQLITVSLDDFLLKNSAPREIDYLSIDTEGSEFEILSTFPFDKWRIRFLSVEHNFTGNRIRIRELLETVGYGCIEAKWDDWYFLD